jgi:hypothetical protein
VQTLLTVLVVLVLVAMYVTWTAGRLDRQHVRVEAGRSALDAALVRRAALAEQLSEQLAEPLSEQLSEVADRPAAGPGPAALAAAARRARDADADERERAENDLTRVLRPLVARAASYGAGEAPLSGLVDQLAAATARIGLARSIYNNAVDQTLALRRRRLVRWLRLAGRAAAPAYFEIDDTWQDLSPT